MSWLKSLIYGFVCGISEFLPISSLGHRSLFTMMFGSEVSDPVSDLIIHISLLSVVIISCYASILRIRRDNRLAASGRGRRNRGSLRAQYDLRLIRTASVPLICVLLLRPFVQKLTDNPIALALFFILNGLLLYIPSRLLHANKNARNMSAVDGFLIGIAGGLSIFPGISRIGASVSAASARGADHKEAFQWALLLSIPALATQIILDLFSLPGASYGSVGFLHYLLSAIGSFGGGYFSVILMRTITFKSGISGFAFYSWGAAMLALILYMIV